MNKKHHTIAFLWVGNNIEIPNALVSSIRLVMGNNVNVVQLTDGSSQKVDKVDSVKRYDLPNQIMLARLMAYSKFEPETHYTFFCDADSLFVNKLVIPEDTLEYILLTPRQQDFLMNHNFPEYYEEFVGKRANEVMRFLFGAIITKDNQQFFFKNLLDTCLQLPPRFHRWYGDQYALNKIIQRGFDKYEELNSNIYLSIIREPLTHEYLKELLEKKVQFITFKGPQAKIFIKNSLNILEEYYSHNNI